MTNVKFDEIGRILSEASVTEQQADYIRSAIMKAIGDRALTLSAQTLSIMGEAPISAEDDQNIKSVLYKALTDAIIKTIKGNEDKIVEISEVMIDGVKHRGYKVRISLIDLT
jgi:hypothetical protein